MSRRQLTRQQVLYWNDRWNYRDRARITNALDVLPDHAYAYLPPSEGYIGVMVFGELQGHSFDMFGASGSGREGWYRAVVIHPGCLEWPGGRWSNHLDKELFPALEEGEKVNYDFMDYFQWCPLSTIGRMGPHGAKVPEKKPVTCPNCNLQLPATGICDFC